LGEKCLSKQKKGRAGMADLTPYLEQKKIERLSKKRKGEGEG